MKETITSGLARSISNNIVKSNQEQIDKINEKILESARINNFFCYIYHDISKIVKNDFKKRGFIIEDMSRFSNGNLFKIYW
jgi:hypothetical protein